MTDTALLVITDGRTEHIEQTVRSASANLAGRITEKWVYDDSGDPDNWARLRRHMPDFHLIVHPDGRQGFGGAIRHAWTWLNRWSRADYVFHLEDDFTFNQPIDLAAMAVLIERHPQLAQVALRRQPWNASEIAAGGIVEQHPGDYTDRYDIDIDVAWLEHRRFFSTNPCLYRRSLVAGGWPEGDQSEGRFGVQLVEQGSTFAYLGARDTPPMVNHNGTTRNGTGY